MFGNVFGFSIGLGLLTAMDTLCTQAIGAGRPKLLGVLLQRSWVVIATLSVPMLLVQGALAEKSACFVVAFTPRPRVGCPDLKRLQPTSPHLT